MKRIIQLLLITAICSTLSSQSTVDFNPYKFQREATDQLLKHVENSLMEQIHSAIANGEKTLSKAVYLEEMLEPLKSYGIDPQKEGYYLDIQEYYKKYVNDPNFDPKADLRAGFEQMIKTKITGEIYGIIGKENIEMASELGTIFSNANKKITGILEALESVSNINNEAERKSQFEEKLAAIGVTGKFFEAIGDLEVLIGQTAEEISDPLQIITAIVNASAETNPTNKIKMLFDFGETYGGRLPIVGDIVSSLFTVGKMLIEAAERAGGIIESNVDQYCIDASASHNVTNNSKKESFIRNRTGFTACPMRNNGIYQHIYVNQDQKSRIYFYINGQWFDGTVSAYHTGENDIFALVQWLVQNGYAAKAKDLNFVKNAYNKIYGFNYFKEQIIKQKLQEIKQLSSQVLEKVRLCDETYLSLFFMELLQFQKLNEIMANHGGFTIDDLRFLDEGAITKITNEILKRRYVSSEVGLIGALNTIAKKLRENIPVSVKGKVSDEHGNAIANARVEPGNGGNVLFNGSNCDQSTTYSSGAYEFLYVPTAESDELLHFSVIYEGVREQKEMRFQSGKNIYELDFTIELGKKEKVIDADNDGYDADEDCDDSNAAIHPGAEEILDNEIDENCDGLKEYSLSEDGLAGEQDLTLRIIPDEASVEVAEKIAFRVELVDHEGNAQDVTDETLVINPFSSRRSGEFTVSATYKDYSTRAIIKVRKAKKCADDNEEWNADLAICQCKKGYTRADDGKCVEIVQGNDPSGNINTCLKENEEWNEDLLECVCIEGYTRNANGKCVEIVQGNDPSGNINTCLKENEEWNEDLLECVCIEGYTRNANGKCVEIIQGNDPSGNINRCLKEYEEWNEDLLECECIEGYTRNANGKCVEIVQGNDPSGNINTCLKENEEWNENLLKCECIEGYTRNANGKCVEIVQGNDPSGNINTCLKENEEWNEDLLECECIEGYTRNANGKCVEIVQGNDPSGNINTCLRENEEWNEDLLKCECIEGYTRNANGKCVEIVQGNDPSGNINTCIRENEVWNESKLECDCIPGFSRNEQGKCVSSTSTPDCNCPDGYVCDQAGNCIPLEDAINDTEEGLEDDCLEFSEVEGLIRPLLTEYRGLEGKININIRKFNKEINDRAAIPCENKLLSFSYYSVQALLERMQQIEKQLTSIYVNQISFFSFTNHCPDFSDNMNSAGFNTSFVTNELGKFKALKERIAGLENLLIENGCDPTLVEQEGQTVQPPGTDPDFIDNGGTSTEIDGDGKDNDGDGQQDEIPVQGLPGYNVTIIVYDSGGEKDDIFGLSLDGQGFLGNSPKGGLRSYGLDLPVGSYSGTLEVVLAADDVGTYTINVLHNNQSLFFASGKPPEGTRIPFSFTFTE